MSKVRCSVIVGVQLAAFLIMPAAFFPVFAAVASSEGHPGSVAAATHRQVERERIRNEHAALTARRQQDEAACYQRFAVEDCLRGVRAKAREAQDRLRAQEIEINDAERREKAAARMRSIEDKQAELPLADKRTDVRVRKSAADTDAARSQRDQDALQRAQQQKNSAQAQASEQAARAAASAERAAQSRARHVQALEAANERRARVEKSQADALAQGRKPAAPLPAPSGSASESFSSTGSAPVR